MMSSTYPEMRLLHVACVAVSGTLFTFRGLMRIADLAIANHWALRWTSYLVDTALLSAAIGLTLALHQYPFVNAWLTTKVVLLPLYITSGLVALQYARTRPGRSAAFLAAVLIFAYIVGVAIAHDPAGWFAFIR